MKGTMSRAQRVDVQYVDGITLGISREQLVVSRLIRFKLTNGSPTITILCPTYPGESSAALQDREKRLLLFVRQSFSQI